MLAEWQLIARDLRDQGIDVWDVKLLRSRPWSWLRDCVIGLFDRPASYVTVGHPDTGLEVHTVFSTRVQTKFYAKQATS